MGRVLAVLWTLAGCVSAATPSPSQTAPPEPTHCASFRPPVALATVDSDELDEASGLAVSRRDPDLLWMIEDSGADAEVWAVRRDGSVRARIPIAASAVDWEDLALGPCGDQDCLYIADTGDNAGTRTEVEILRFPEPPLDAELIEPERFPFGWPGGPQDCEALATLPDERVLLFGKTPGNRAEVVRFEALGEPPASLGEVDTGDGISLGLTAADLSPEGDRLLLRGYFTLREYEVTEAGVGLDVKRSRAVPAPVESQGESVAWDPHLGGYLTVTEEQGGHPVIQHVPCR